ncbi:HAMP domain-containing protein [Gemmata sp. G18]|uniref:HAMP domain-containing protein n=1 Tax=Gemmata palustris TaxID=2822762 RepID=A0ABS5BYT4_9BACT|nr:methyl-accepting chemotaxis protein [Gemmata palustris]MBP3958900.1 HAMP domain-containing protein [Gemmata palustris]
MLTPMLAALMKVRIGPRLIGGFLLIASGCAFLGYTALGALGEIRAFQVNAATNLVPGLINLDKARAGALRAQRAERTLIACGQRGDEPGIRSARESVEIGWNSMNEGLKGYDALPLDEKETVLWKQVQAALGEWKRDHDEIMGLAARREFEKADEAAARELKTANRMNELLQQVIALQEEIAKDEEAQANRTYTAARTSLRATIAGCVLAAIGLGLVLSLSVTGPLGQTVAVLESVTRGDLTKHAEIDSQDEVGRLAAALNTAIDTLRAARGRDADFAGQIAAVSKAQAVIEFKLDGTIVSANENFLQTMGYSLSEIQGRHHSMFAEPAFASSPEYREFWARLNRGEYVASEFKRIGKGGKEVWIQASYNPIFDLNGKPYKVVKYATDITVAKNMEQKIKESGERDRERAAELQHKVATITTTVSSLAAGDFTRPVPDLGTDEVGQMAAALNRAVDAMRTALEGVREVSEHLADASSQLSSSSGELSTGAQEQASSLEETASTMEEITATVKQNSDSAQQARQLASSSKDVAEKGGQVVGSAVEAMSEINQSSKKIADIITTIDEIAFQTNLLALNAAVEAARAGEQGRGFAVVASEVRNLAQRSATSAKEIKSLIEDSVKKVDAGTELVNRSGATLGDIVTSVKRVTDIITEIAAASKEQSTGIDQVNKAVSQMDSITQRNASQTEEVSATAQALTDHAEQLRDLVARFKLGDEGRAVPRVTPKVGRAKPPATKPRPAVARAMSTGNGRAHELDRLGSAGNDGFTEF